MSATRRPPESRLKSSADFARIYAMKVKAADGVLLVFGQLNQLEHARIGLSVSRKRGGAVVRNREKRVLREAFRLLGQGRNLAIDLVVIPIGSQPPSLAAYQTSLSGLIERLFRRLSKLATNHPAPLAPDAQPPSPQVASERSDT